jgi:hypothetical protein
MVSMGLSPRCEALVFLYRDLHTCTLRVGGWVVVYWEWDISLESL